MSHFRRTPGVKREAEEDWGNFAALTILACSSKRPRNGASLNRLDDVNEEQVVRDLKAKGHKLQWVREDRLRRLKQNGWKLVVERDLVGRPTNMDRLKELVLVHRARKGE